MIRPSDPTGAAASRATSGRRLILILVSFRTPPGQVEDLRACLDRLDDSVGYAIVVNQATPEAPIEALADGAELVLRAPANLGYGRAVNLAFSALRRRLPATPMPAWIGALNTDLQWEPGSFEAMLNWLEDHDDVGLAVPRILDRQGDPQQLCKRDPTVLALLSRRFVPDAVKCPWLRRYDEWFVMADQDLGTIFEVPYLSGCCMIIRSSTFEHVGGFDEDYFLYLEDADLTRLIRHHGRTVHLPVASVMHGWGRGNHRSWRLTLVNLQSAFLYFRKWGLRWW